MEVKRFLWASRGDFPIYPGDAQDIAYCQKLEELGFALRADGLSEDQIDPNLAVIFPGGKILSYSELADALEKNLPREVNDAINYLRAYRRLYPYAPKFVQLFIGRLPI